MSQKNNYLVLIIIFILAFLAGNFAYPNYYNKAVDSLNQKFNWSLSHFWDKPYKLGLDLQGGVLLEYDADLSAIPETQRAEVMQGLKDIIENRVNFFGVAEPLIQIQGQNRLIVELPGAKDVGEAIKWIGETPYLEFKESLSDQEKEDVKKTIPESDILRMQDEYRKFTGKEATKEDILNFLTSNLFKSTELTGRYLKRAEVTFNQTTGAPQIALEFDSDGAKLLEDISARNIGKSLAIFLDGRSIVDTNGNGVIDENDLYAPTIETKITGGNAIITGNMDIKRAKEIVRRLNSGALPVKIGEPVSQQNIGPTLGKISLDESLKAGFIGLLLVVIYMLIFYRIPGLFACIALLIYIVFHLTIIKVIPITITLSGIAGYLLSMGMALDANILIFSRMREELREGKSYLTSLEEGSRRAWPSIRDGNLTTILVGLILFFFGTSFVKGFALTLVIGNLIGMFTAIVIINNILRLFPKDKSAKWIWFWK